jgi:hypothetical protein
MLEPGLRHTTAENLKVVVGRDLTSAGLVARKRHGMHAVTIFCHKHVPGLVF